jgi:hypothetical protein
VRALRDLCHQRRLEDLTAVLDDWLALHQKAIAA